MKPVMLLAHLKRYAKDRGARVSGVVLTGAAVTLVEITWKGKTYSFSGAIGAYDFLADLEYGSRVRLTRKVLPAVLKGI